jgi:hypothetical protein
VHPPAVRGEEARVLRHRRRAEDVAHLLEDVVVAGADDEPLAVAGLEHLERGDVRMPRAERARHDAGHQVRRERVLEDRQLAVEHRHVDERPLPRLRALHEGRLDADRQEEPGGDVADRDADPRRRPAARAGEAQDAAHRLHDHVVGAPRAERPRLAEAGRGAVDEPRPTRVHRVPAVAEPLHRPGAEVLDQHVGGAEELVEDAAIVLTLQVERDRLLVVVERGEVEALPAHERADAAREVADARLLHLDDARAEVREDERRVRPREDARQVDDRDAGERPRIRVAHASTRATAATLRPNGTRRPRASARASRR